MEQKQSLFALLRGAGYTPCEASFQEVGSTVYGMLDVEPERELLIAGAPDARFSGRRVLIGGQEALLCQKSHENLLALQEVFPWTVPASPQGHNISMGLGDRLGLVSGAHIQALRGTEVFPVLAQQSKRELNLTGRSNRQMMEDVAWQVFEAGYTGGYGADGDHRKTLEEVCDALYDGVTMITLDCSEHIDNDAHLLREAEAWENCRALFSAEDLARWTAEYCGKSFPLEGRSVEFTPAIFPQLLLTYARAVEFAAQVYEQAIAPCSRKVAFEVSIDETEIDTLPCAHYFVAAELVRRGVVIESMAPRFYGEFQKGIDYIGDLAQFEAEFADHVAIAEHFGYRISVHSGSDKFSVFPYVGRLSHGRFHLKTSGTSWVEAVRVIAACEPALFRRMVPFACAHFAEARKYYHVTCDPARVPDLREVSDAELPGLMDQIDTRQVMHINYGLLLQAKNPDGTPEFRDDIYRVLRAHRAELDEVICRHIQRHLRTLGLLD